MIQESNNQINKFAERAHHNAIWVVVMGVLLIIFGIFALLYMGMSTMAAVYCFGVLMVIGGIFQIIGAFQIYSGFKVLLWGLCGVLYMAAGWLTFSNPFLVSAVLTIFLAISLSIGGIFKLIGGFQLKPFSGWGWIVFSGILSLMTGILIFSTPDSAFWVIGMFLGIDMIFQGWSFVTIGLAVKSMKDN